MSNTISYIFSCLIAIGLLFLSSCSDDETVAPTITIEEQFENDQALIDQYLATNNLPHEIEEATGLRYHIVNQGNENMPTRSDDVNVNYEGRLMTNGTVFDSGEEVIFPLNALITGWQIGIPLIGEGGEIILYIPSGYAYGTASVGSIPPNSNLDNTSAVSLI